MPSVERITNTVFLNERSCVSLASSQCITHLEVTPCEASNLFLFPRANDIVVMPMAFSDSARCCVEISPPSLACCYAIFIEYGERGGKSARFETSSSQSERDRERSEGEQGFGLRQAAAAGATAAAAPVVICAQPAFLPSRLALVLGTLLTRQSTQMADDCLSVSQLDYLLLFSMHGMCQAYYSLKEQYNHAAPMARRAA